MEVVVKKGVEKNKKIETDDFYMENGYMVFTAKYHLKRGYCCQSGCRHCPYESPKDTVEKSVKLNEEQ